MLEAERRVIRDIASREDRVTSDAARLRLGRRRSARSDPQFGLAAVAVVQSLVGRSWGDVCLFGPTVDTSSVGLDRAAALVTAATDARPKARE